MTLMDAQGRINELKDMIRTYEHLLTNPGMYRDDALIRTLIKRHLVEIEGLKESIHLEELDDMGVKDE